MAIFDRVSREAEKLLSQLDGLDPLVYRSFGDHCIERFLEGDERFDFKLTFERNVEDGWIKTEIQIVENRVCCRWFTPVDDDGVNRATILVRLCHGPEDEVLLATLSFQDYRSKGYTGEVSDATFQYIRNWARHKASPYLENRRRSRDQKQRYEEMLRKKYLP